MFERYAAKQNSAHGEDGLLDWLWTRAVRAGWSEPRGSEKFVCEFGAHDGVSLSNTYYLVFARGFGGLYIESDPARFTALERTVERHPGLRALNARVGWDGSADPGIDELLDQHGAPARFHAMSIDVDGPDYFIWRDNRRFRPDVVVIESHGVWPPDEHVVWQEGIPHGRRGGSTSFGPLRDLAAEKGYLPIAYFGNLVSVTREFYEAVLLPHHGPPPPPDALWFEWTGRAGDAAGRRPDAKPKRRARGRDPTR